MLTRIPQIIHIYHFQPKIEGIRAEQGRLAKANQDVIDSFGLNHVKRDSTPLVTPDWARSQLSTPRKVRRDGQIVEVDWAEDRDARGDAVDMDDPMKPGAKLEAYKYWREETEEIKARSIYVMEDDCDETHPVSKSLVASTRLDLGKQAMVL